MLTKLSFKNKTKEQVLMQPNNHDLLLETALHEQYGEESLTEEKERFVRNKMFFIIALSNRQFLAEQAQEFYNRIELIKENMIAWQEYISAITDEKFKKFMIADDLERAKHEAQMDKLIKDELDRIEHESGIAWKLHQKNIDSANNRLSNHRDERSKIVKESAVELRKAMDDFHSSSPASNIYANISSEKKNEFSEQFIIERHKGIRRIQHGKEDKQENIQKLKELQEQVVEITNKTKQSLAKTPEQILNEGNNPEFRAITSMFSSEKRAYLANEKNSELKEIKQQMKEIETENAKIDIEIEKHELYNKNIYFEVAKKVFGEDIANKIKDMSPNEQVKFLSDPKVARVLKDADSALHKVNDDMRIVKKDINVEEGLQIKIAKDCNMKSKDTTTKLDMPQRDFDFNSLKKGKRPGNGPT